MFYHVLNFVSSEPSKYFFPEVLQCDADIFVVYKNETFYLLLKILEFNKNSQNILTHVTRFAFDLIELIN